MTLRSLFKRSKKKLAILLRMAIQQHDVEEVKNLLQEGADPNDFADSAEYYRPLGLALRCKAPLQTFEELLKAGADPQEPYRFLGQEFLLSDAAEKSGLPQEVVQCLRMAEQKAETQNGPRTLFQIPAGKSCCQFSL